MRFRLDRPACYALLLVAGLLSACVQTTRRLYEPQAGEGVVHRGTSNFGIPHATYSLPLGSDVLLSVSGGPDGADAWFAVTMLVPEGRRARFESSRVELRSAELAGPVIADLDRFTFTIPGDPKARTPGSFAYFAATAELTGAGPTADAPLSIPRRAYQTSVRFSGVRPQQLSLTLPPLVVEGKRIKPAPISFVYREQQYRMYGVR